MDFVQALSILKCGGKVTRAGWDGRNQFIFVDYYPNEDKGYSACMCMSTGRGTIQPGWLASQEDLLANDWALFVESEEMENSGCTNGKAL